MIRLVVAFAACTTITATADTHCPRQYPHPSAWAAHLEANQEICYNAATHAINGTKNNGKHNWCCLSGPCKAIVDNQMCSDYDAHCPRQYPHPSAWAAHLEANEKICYNTATHATDGGPATGRRNWCCLSGPCKAVVDNQMCSDYDVAAAVYGSGKHAHTHAHTRVCARVHMFACSHYSCNGGGRGVVPRPKKPPYLSWWYVGVHGPCTHWRCWRALFYLVQPKVRACMLDVGGMCTRVCTHILARACVCARAGVYRATMYRSYNRACTRHTHAHAHARTRAIPSF